MEYYDSINKTDLYEFYLNKSNHLLMNPNVIKILDKEGLGNVNSDIDLFKTEQNKALNTSPDMRRRRSNSLKLAVTTKRMSKRIMKLHLDEKPKV
jgi:hypothetical protein